MMYGPLGPQGLLGLWAFGDLGLWASGDFGPLGIFLSFGLWASRPLILKAFGDLGFWASGDFGPLGIFLSFGPQGL